MKFPGIKGLRPHLAGVCIVLTFAVGIGRAGDNDAELRSLLEQQSKQIAEQQKQLEDLKKRLDAAETAKVEAQPASAHGASLNEGAVQKIVTEYLEEKDKKEKDDAKAQQKKAEDEGYKVGTILNNVTARWDPANGMRLETPNKDFTFHAGYRFQLDQAYWTQTSASLKAAQLGDLQDGTFFRRSRPSFDGTMWEVVEFNVELALEQVQNGVPNFDEAWVGVKSIPIIGAVQIGHMKVPQGLEGDMYSSSKAMTFLERSAYTDAFYENFATGIRLTNSFLDQRMTYAAMAYFQDNNPINTNNNNAVFFGDGVAGYTGRVTALPLWENDGRCFLHLGASGTWRNNARPGQDLADPRLDRFRARPQLRDAIGDFGNGVLPGNSSRMVDTGTFASTSTGIVGLELLYVMGPFSFQSEYAWATAHSIFFGGKNIGERGFEGGYVQLSYFLTGENRIYDRRWGREGSTYIARPYTPFWFVRDAEGGTSWGRGAWELAARWNTLNLNDAPIEGGRLDGLEFGINWYLNTNLKIQFMYLNEKSFGQPAGKVPANVDAFGIRTQVFF
jgi:phosphate-selective porin OprO/OprP